MRDRQIIRVRNTGLTLHYLNLSEEEKKVQAEGVIRKSLETMNFKTVVSLSRKTEIIKGMLERSIIQLEKEEEFEECQILHDLIGALPRVYKDLKSEVTS